MSERYRQSEELLQRALKTIPLGSQTYSKSLYNYPYGASPFFIKRGDGSCVWDVDGNQYIDFVNALLPVILGYNDPDVTSAVLEQLNDGVIFSLAHPIEVKVSEKIVEMVPCAEMVRFGKNGSDATSGAVRLARAYTKRDHIAVCGYHGWQDWYIGTTPRKLGVPKPVQELAHSFNYNDIDSLHALFRKYNDQIAAVIIEPMNVIEPGPGYLEAVKELTHKNGALLIFDEMITGFRFSRGGAQEYFNVTPDLATFGKSMANGYPVSAVVGKADIMRLMEEIFFSFTFSGETLSLAATYATLQKIQNQPVIETIRKQGQKIKAGLEGLIAKYDVSHILKTSGNPVWSFLLFQDTEVYTKWEIRTLFMQEMLARGIIVCGTHNISYSHSDDDVNELLEAYNEVLPLLKGAVIEKDLHQKLTCKMLQPVFQVR